MLLLPHGLSVYFSKISLTLEIEPFIDYLIPFLDHLWLPSVLYSLKKCTKRAHNYIQTEEFRCFL